MTQTKGRIIVYYDGACPKCVKDRENYEKFSGKAGQDVCWFDITGKKDQLREIGIDPQKALPGPSVGAIGSGSHREPSGRSHRVGPAQPFDNNIYYSNIIALSSLKACFSCPK